MLKRTARHNVATMSTLCVLSAALAVLAGCGNDSTSPGNMGSVTLNVGQLGNTAKLTTDTDHIAAASVDLSRARFVLRRIKFHTDIGEEMEISTDPMVVDLNLQGALNIIAVASLPPGLYSEVRFDVHRLDPEDPLDQPFLAQPEFADFAGEDRPSMLIEGAYDDGTQAADFTFSSTVNDEQRIELATPLRIEAGTSVDVTMTIDTASWFVDAQGAILDPSSPETHAQIEDNIRNSIEAFEDRDRDGQIDS